MLSFYKDQVRSQVTHQLICKYLCGMERVCLESGNNDIIETGIPLIPAIFRNHHHGNSCAFEMDSSGLRTFLCFIGKLCQ